MHHEQSHKVVIVGGGTAGWMSALICAKQWEGANVSITLLESQTIPINGVGEGSTPALKLFFDWLNISESEWMSVCDATYKTGIQFNNWSGLEAHPSYFHAFPNELDRRGEALFYKRSQSRLSGASISCKPDDFFLASYLSNKKLAPVPGENFPFIHNYGYHFDAHKLARFLKEKSVNFGIEHKYGSIHDIENEINGDISALVLESGDKIEADLFIDCTGFRSLLLGQNLQENFQSYDDVLFNDTAITLATEIDTSSVNSCTTSTALDAGWVWNIPLKSRIGNGYVYSSKYISDESAAKEFKEFLGVSQEIEVRKLDMKIGRYQRQWSKNCIAIGLSQGFIEPLEATGLFAIQQTAAIFAKAYQDGEFTAELRDQVNKRLVDMFDGIKDYIVAHYKTSSRQDTLYWRDNQEGLNEISPSLKQLLSCWYSGKDLKQEIFNQNIAQFYTPMSWYSLLSGMGLFPNPNGYESVADKQLLELKSYYEKCCMNYKSHADILFG